MGFFYILTRLAKLPRASQQWASIFSILAITIIGFSETSLASDDVPQALNGIQYNAQKLSVHLEQNIMLDGKSFSKSDLIEDFVNIAFSEKPWPEDDLGSIRTQHDAKMLYRRYPWLAEYIFRTQGAPNTVALHKWTHKKVRIGYDWPIYSEQPKPPLRDESTGKSYKISHASEYPKFAAQFLDGDYKDVLLHLQSLIPELEKLTKIDLKWQSPDSEAESSRDYARIRIVPAWANKQKNFFKMYRWGGEKIDYDYWTLQRHEYELQGAISFTTDARSSVDGYIIPAANEGLDMAVCKITPLVGKEMMKALITECLIRALGLPSLSRMPPPSLLGEWNQEYNAYSKLKDLDGRDVALWKDIEYQPQSDYYPKADEFPIVKKEIKPFQRLSEYDRLMVKLLYCEGLKAGMSKEQVRRELISNLQCFK